jgi:hypothetical protein
LTEIQAHTSAAEKAEIQSEPPQTIYTPTEADRQRMDPEADLAFRQAWALCRYSPEAVYRYVDYLVTRHRQADALLIAQTAAKFQPSRLAEGFGTQARSMAEQMVAQFRSLAEQLATQPESK